MNVSTGLRSKVTETIAGWILSGELQPNEILPTEADLSVKLGVGRNTTREAIKVLGSKGLIETRTKRGSRVSPRSEWSLLDPEVVRWRLAVDQDVSFILSLCDVRMIFEPAAAERAAKFANAEQLQRMSSALDRMAAAQTANSYTAADMEFHATILEAAGNELLLQLGSALEAALIASRRVTLAIDNSANDTIDVHRQIFKAISNKKAAAAKAAMEELLSVTLSHVMVAVTRKPAENAK